ncbi:MAG: hypothetical protein HZB91_06860 [Elusimicrobia bacterium]|nr:hypothetical protein [Elusimicrobiota bacterium]
MTQGWRGLLKSAGDILREDDDPAEPRYDPVHLAGVLVGCMAAAGALYWLLWTLLVFEGGLPAKVGPALSVLLTDKTLADYGCCGPAAMGAFEGWRGNLSALLMLVMVLFILLSAYRKTAGRGT